MQKATEILKQIISTEQYRKSIEILELFSEYHQRTGYELPKPTVMHDLNLSFHDYDYIIAGSTDVEPRAYNRMISYLKHQCNLALQYQR